MSSTLSRAVVPALALAAPLAIALAGCGDNSDPSSADDDGQTDGSDGDGDGDGDPSEAAFAPDRVLTVDITMPTADWDALRTEGNDVYGLIGPDCQAAPPGRSFTWFTAEVTLDGEVLPDVSIRKKGFLGSLSLSRPSLKLDLDREVDDREWRGLEKLTLNNNQQDGSTLRTCLAYAVFRAAGVPAPRCSLAHVTVNGEDLGVYANVESVTPRMLARWFDDGQGSLYEGSASDIRSGWDATYEQKNDDLVGDRGDLDEFVAAVDAASDEEILDVVSARIDLDGFLTFWAAENLLGHWDSYSNTSNNYFLYREPGGDRFHFLPWGPDQAFIPADPFATGARPTSVSANGWLAHRLYALPAVREQYVAAMETLLADAWDESALLAEVDRMATLIEPHITDEPRFTADVDKLETFIEGRRAQLTPELDGGGAAWEIGPRGSPCLVVGGTLAGSFATTWGSVALGNPLASGTGTLILTRGGVDSSADPVGSASGIDTDFGLGRRQMIQVGGAFPDGLRALIILIAPEAYRAGADIPLDWQSAFAVLGRLDGVNLAVDGVLGRGTIHLDEAGEVEDAPVTGTVTSDILQVAPATP